ncbi:transmembrane and coiled-coil domains protein 1 [Austrofundulus limnaeus]|uniref:Transmembrane and coiled-coil domains protein 1 n=1 Tax=Austrofundulus limnaeus TaxID=52670 RepID=A0A2I4B295_AUSLI|nr:PREDICTED: transmembrane and coiled-coil domains protein 1-like [Austrofundulus limnaeus]
MTSPEASGFDEIQQIQEAQDRLQRSLEVLKINHQRDHMMVLELLEEDKLRFDGLKQELADLKELHEREMGNLKEELLSSKDKTDCRHHERKEFHDAIEARHSRLPEAEQQQQNMERDEDTILLSSLGKIIGMLLVVLTSILVFVSMATQ